VLRRLRARVEDQARLCKTWYEFTPVGSYSPFPRTAKVKANRQISSRIRIPNARRSRTLSPLSNTNLCAILTESARHVLRNALVFARA
jgi:hypothetical protein